MIAVNSCWATLSSVPIGTDGTLPQPSAKPPSLITVSPTPTSATHFRCFTPMPIHVW